jgi:hypothetical protein
MESWTCGEHFLHRALAPPNLEQTRNSFFFTGAILLGQSQGFAMQALGIHFKGMAAQFEAIKMQALAERHEQVY